MADILSLIGVAKILDRRKNKLGVAETYVSYLGEDKRLDEWIKEEHVGQVMLGQEGGHRATAPSLPVANGNASRKSEQEAVSPNLSKLVNHDLILEELSGAQDVSNDTKRSAQTGRSRATSSQLLEAPF